jgi:nucleoside diphosphate kinase
LNWNNLSFVICKPDAVYLNLEREIVSFLEDMGFRILACKYETITPDLCRQLYWNDDYDITSNWWWKLEAEFFSLGESLCLLIEGVPTSPYQSLSEMIDRKIKGNNKPELARSGTIRHTFGARNRVFNLFHSADCTSAAQREASLFFNIEKIRQLDYPSCLSKQKEKGSLDMMEVYFRIKQRCLREAKIDSIIKQKYQNYIEDKVLQSKSVTKARRQIWLYEMLEEEYWLFYEELQENTLLKAVTDYKRFRRLNYDSLFKLLGKLGIKLTKWESCLLKTTMLVPPKDYR